MVAADLRPLGSHLVFSPTARALVEDFVKSLRPILVFGQDAAFFLPGEVVVLECLDETLVDLFHAFLFQFIGCEQKREVGFRRLYSTLMEVPERRIDMMAVTYERGHRYAHHLAEFAERFGKDGSRTAE